MNIFRIFNSNSQKKKEQLVVPTFDPIKIKEFYRILTDNNQTVMEAIELYFRAPQEFQKIDQEFWTEYPSEDYLKNYPEDIIGLWLSYNVTEHTFGAFLDWKAETDDILWFLECIVKNKKYNLNLSEITFSDEEDTLEALSKINDFIKKEGFILVNRDTGGDDYQIFIIEEAQYGNLMQFVDNSKLNITRWDKNESD